MFLQLTLEQRRFELYRFTYMEIFFNTYHQPFIPVGLTFADSANHALKILPNPSLRRADCRVKSYTQPSTALGLVALTPTLFKSPLSISRFP